MYPDDVVLSGLRLSVWNATFLVAVALGYPLLRLALRQRRGTPLPRLLWVRWLATVYASALGAQLFACLFDLSTTALPPESVSWVRYYLDPLSGPKTLYGAVLALPLGALAVSVPWGDLRYGEALDAWTPPMLGVLGIVRFGCFLQGCCYGIPSTWLGVTFPPEGTVYHHQVTAGLIAPGDSSLPVLPTQLIEAAGLFGLCTIAMIQLRRGVTGVFLPAVAAYSVFRFSLEFVRGDPERNFLGPLSTSQWVALAVLGCYVVWRRAARA